MITYKPFQIRALITQHYIFGEWSDVIEVVTEKGGSYLFKILKMRKI